MLLASCEINRKKYGVEVSKKSNSLVEKI